MAILLGLFGASFGLFHLWRSIRLRLKGRFTIGNVSKVTMIGRTPEIYVSFKNSKNRTVVFKAGGWTGINISPLYQIGSSVPVLYDPNNSSDAVIYTFDFMYLLPLAFTGLGFFFIYIGFTH